MPNNFEDGLTDGHELSGGQHSGTDDDSLTGPAKRMRCINGSSSAHGPTKQQQQEEQSQQ